MVPYDEYEKVLAQNKELEEQTSKLQEELDAAAEKQKSPQREKAEKCCAGITPDKHRAALQTIKKAAFLFALYRNRETPRPRRIQFSFILFQYCVLGLGLAGLRAHIKALFLKSSKLLVNSA